MPSSETLLDVRGHLAERSRILASLSPARAIEGAFGGCRANNYRACPKALPPTHPAADLLRYKSFILYTQLEPEVATTPEFYSEVLTRFKLIKPFLDFLTAPSRAKPAKIDPRDLFV